MTPPPAQPLYFGPRQRALFGWLHRPASHERKDIGIVLCSPSGYEAICTHRTYRRLAEDAAAQGFAALRFDYDGTGDSAGDDLEREHLLVDGNGMRLSGGLRSPTNEDVGDRVAAELAGVSKEASRTTRLLGLGGWQAIAVESPEGNLFLLPPTPDTVLLTMRERSLPMARLGLIAERAARDARAWLGVQE